MTPRPGALPDAARCAAARPRRPTGAGRRLVAVTAFGFEARDCAERLRRGDRIGVTGRIEQVRHRTPNGWRVDHSVLIDQLDLPANPIKDSEEER